MVIANSDLFLGDTAASRYDHTWYIQAQVGNFTWSSPCNEPGSVGHSFWLLVVLYWFQNSFLTNAFLWIMEKLSLFKPYESFVNMVLSVPALVYYVLIAALFLFFTCQTLEKRRWN